MSIPKVSVLIPAYNYANYIEEAIESVLKQTCQNFELIIVDNCSTDNTKEVVEQYIQKDSRIKLVINNVNIGMYRNYNKALLLANGEYIKFLNADDKLHEKCLEIFVDILDKNQNVSVVTSYRQFFGSRDDVLMPKFVGKVESQKAVIEVLKHGNWIGEPTTVMFRRKNLYSGFFDVSILMFADMDMWLRQLENGDLYIHNEVLSYFRIHGEQGTEYLNADLNKRLFNSLQLSTYIIYSLIFNRFSHDFFVSNKKEYDELLNKNTTRILKNIWKTMYWHNKFKDILTLKASLKYFEGFIKKLVGYYKW